MTNIGLKSHPTYWKSPITSLQGERSRRLLFGKYEQNVENTSFCRKEMYDMPDNLT